MSPCNEGIDPEHNPGGEIDPGDDPSPPSVQLYIDDTDSGAIPPNTTDSVEFTISLNRFNFTSTTTVHWATRDGTAQAGRDYTAASGTATFTPGTGNVDITINILARNVEADLNFFVDLSSPVNASIVDGTGKANIHYNHKGGGGDTGPKITDKVFVSVPIDEAILYDQFAGCCHDNQCTAWGPAGALTAQYQYKRDKVKRFDAAKAFIDLNGSGAQACGCGCQKSGGYCPGFSTAAMLEYMVGTGMRECDLPANGNYNSGNRTYACDSSGNNFRKIDAYHVIQGSTRNKLITKMKKAIIAHGVVIITSSWYHAWNSPGSRGGHRVLQDVRYSNGNWPPTPIGHAYFSMGWNDTIAGGSFLIQNDSGTDYGHGGRVWLPYDYLNVSKTQSADGDPWWRMFQMWLIP